MTKTQKHDLYKLTLFSLMIEMLSKFLSYMGIPCQIVRNGKGYDLCTLKK